MLFVGIMCTWTGAKTFWAEEQNKIFTKWPIRVTDVKKYNQFCGALIIGFTVVAEIIFILSSVFDGWIGTVIMLLIIPAAIVLMRIYRKGEQKFLKK